CACILIHGILQRGLRSPEEPLPHPLVEVIVRATGVSHVTDAIAQRLAEVPMEIPGPCKEREAVIDHGERTVRLSFVDEMVPMGGTVSVAIRARRSLRK